MPKKKTTKKTTPTKINDASLILDNPFIDSKVKADFKKRYDIK